MFYTNSNNTYIQQAGADINTGIHNHILNKGLWTQETNTYQLTRSQKAPKGANNWLTNLAARLIGKSGRPFNAFAQAAR